MTIPEIAAQLRVALGDCVNADNGVSAEERRFFITLQSASDQEIIALWLALSNLRERYVTMIVAKQWAKEANDISEWMALLELNTAPQGNN
jgi:hypothetical protein